MNPALADLKDIHLPAASAWWDIAYGWWVLLLLVIVLLVWGLPKLRFWYQSKKTKKILSLSIKTDFQTIRENYDKNKNAHQTLTQLSILLRRVALTVFEEQHTAGLVADDWLAFLDAQWGASKPEFSFAHPDIAGLLTEGAYQRMNQPDSVQDMDTLFEVIEGWLNTVVKYHV